MQTIAQPVKIIKKSDTRTATFAKNVKKKMLTRAFSTTFHSNSYDFNGKIYFFANFKKKSTYLERTKFFCSHQKIKITPRNNIPPVHGGCILPPAKNSRGVPRGVTPRTPRLYITMIDNDDYL